MKSKCLLGAIILLMCFTACRKENPIIDPLEPPSIEKPDHLELLKDSVSYTLDGKQIVQSKIISKGLINGESNRKLDSLIERKEYISKDKDSVMFGRFFRFSGADRNEITISFVKKYHKNQAQPANNFTTLFMPINAFDLFSVGERKFALDFSRNNAQNGIVQQLYVNRQELQTNGYPSLAYHALLQPELQSESKFELINLHKLKSGRYIIEAKFNASVYRGDGTNIQKIQNGYLRIKLTPESIYF